MPEKPFDRDAMARWYATRHLKTDPGIKQIYYLRANSPEREIRFLEINDLMAEREADPFEPIDFGVDTGSESFHTLLVLDVTPAQWERIRANEIELPEDWSLDSAVGFPRANR